jgi:HEAT repeat protein
LEDGFFDPAHFPIDSVLKQALSDDRREFDTAVSLLRCMYNYDRKEAGVFLIGLLLTCGNNWEKRRAIATALYDVQTEACVEVLLGEMKRVKNTNSTRRYLKEVIDVLSCMPPPLALPGFEELVAEKSLSPWMRAKVESALGDLAYRYQHGYP